MRINQKNGDRPLDIKAINQRLIAIEHKKRTKNIIATINVIVPIIMPSLFDSLNLSLNKFLWR